MGTKYLMDTNVVIELLGGSITETGTNWLEKLVANNEHSVSVINKIELLGFNGSENEMKVIEDFIEITEILPLSEKVVQETIKLRKTHKIKLPDAIIAATALVHNFILITRNISDFKKVAGLTCIDAHQQ